MLTAIATLCSGSLYGQSTFTESFTGTTAPGWVFGANPGDTQPILTANTIDSPGDGWLRLNTNTNDQSTSALLDTQIFSVNAKIEIEMEFAFFNGTGADGITFFLVDGNQDSSSFTPGAYGGSMGYAQRTGEAGMAGGYLGFALDTFGNYSNDDEGRTGGYTSGLRPNNVVVRGPESSNWAYIDDSGDLGAFDFNGAAAGGTGQSMAFYGSTTRPDQSGTDYREFKITLDANNQLLVEMRFGVGNDYVEVFTSDLSAFERPETFKIGFTGATGGSTGIHEVRNLSLTSSPWSTGEGAYEWDNGAGTTTWGSSAGTEANTNWFASDSGSDNKTPTPDSDILFGNKPSSGPQSVDLANNVEVRNMTFDTPYNYTLDGAGTITFGDTGKVGLPSINVNNYNGDNAIGRHKINNDLSIVENIAIRNFSYSTLCLNGDIALGSNTITTSGYGATNFNGVITGSGPIIVNGATSNPATGQGIVTISGDNSSTYTGTITVNNGQLVVMNNGALGNTGSTTTINDGGSLTLRGGISSAEPLTLAGRGATLGRGTGVGFTEQAGALYNDGGDNTLSGNISLSADSAVGSRDGTLTLSGNISGSGRALSKLGEGTVSLSGSNTYSGATIIEKGALRITTAGALSSSSNLRFDGGVMEIAADLNGGTTGDFSQNIGTGGTNFQWIGDGGFAAYGGDRSVRINNSPTTEMDWGVTTYFVDDGFALVFGSTTADSRLTFENRIDLRNALREIRVIDGSAAVDARLSGRIRNSTGSNGGILKTGDGTLELSNTSGSTPNTYNGATEIQGGALRISNTNARSSSSNIQLNGGVLEIGHTSTFTETLGTGGGQIRWTGDGGFSASGSDRTVRLNNSTASITWGSANFVGADNTLIFGSRSTDATLIWDKAIDLDNGTRTIRVTDGIAASTRAEARLTQALSNGDIVILGNGRLDSGVANGSLAGTVDIQGAELRLNTSGTMTGVTAFNVSAGGTLTLDNAGNSSGTTGGTNLTDRITGTVSLGGGTFNFLGADATSSETIGAVTLSYGANTFNVERNGTNSADLTAASLSRASDSTATIDFTNTGGGGTLGTSGTNPRAIFTAAPTLSNGILPYATVNGTAFATTGANGIEAAASADGSPWVGTYNVTLTDASGALGGATDREVNSIRLNGATGSSIDLSGRNLDIVSGGLLTTDTGTHSITGSGTLTSSSGELIAHTYGSGGLNIEAQISNSGATSVGFTKSGDGVLTLSGTTANTYTGLTTVNAGTLLLAKSDNITAIAGNLTIGDGRGVDIVQLNANEQIADTATVTLRGGEVGNDANVARLELDGATDELFGSRIESFSTLSITGNTVLDFGGGTPCSPTFLNLDYLSVASNSLLTITNWIEFTDFLLVAKATFTEGDLARVIFDGYGGAASWKDYDSGYYQIVPYAPVPEPSSFGALALGTLSAFSLSRRKRRSTCAA